jgi:hypothetical protein
MIICGTYIWIVLELTNRAKLCIPYYEITMYT